MSDRDEQLEIVLEKSGLEIKRLALELEEVYELLIQEVQRDKKLMNGVLRRDELINQLQGRIAALESSKALRVQRLYWNARKNFLRKIKK